jgi:hypothetical protein
MVTWARPCPAARGEQVDAVWQVRDHDFACVLAGENTFRRRNDFERGVEEGGFTGRGAAADDDIFLGENSLNNKFFHGAGVEQCAQFFIDQVVLLADDGVLKGADGFVLFQVEVEDGLLADRHGDGGRLARGRENHLNTVAFRQRGGKQRRFFADFLLGGLRDQARQRFQMFEVQLRHGFARHVAADFHPDFAGLVDGNFADAGQVKEALEWYEIGIERSMGHDCQR